MEHEAQTMMASRFIPSVQFSGVDHAVDLLRLKVHKSAAGIGEVLSNRAVDIKADLMIIASHGAGVLADYGSVARWCSENSPVPTLLLPPAVLQPDSALNSKPAIVVAAVDDIQNLKKSFEFALHKLSRPGDSVYTMLAKPVANEEAGIALRKELVASAHRWLEDSGLEYANTLNVAVDLITEAASDPSVVPEAIPDGSAGSTLSPAGQLICAYAQELGARAVVLHHHGRSMMQEMMYGPVTLQVTKHCPRPLVILGASNSSRS
jgi:nucleotide-binding universal stress UspA family protein